MLFSSKLFLSGLYIWVDFSFVFLINLKKNLIRERIWFVWEVWLEEKLIWLKIWFEKKNKFYRNLKFLKVMRVWVSMRVNI